MSTSSNASPDPTLSQVSWQTAYWTLVPLAINTMAQPSGRVLSLPAKYRTYLRCSPLICAADALSILLHLVYYCATFPPSEAVRLLIRERFGDSEDKDEPEGLQAIERLTFIRWTFFVLGTLGPGIKLMAMENVPWTKAWGAMFLISFIFVEVLVILSWIYVPHRAVALEGQEAAQLLRIQDRLEIFDNLLMLSSNMFYFLVLLFAAMDIHRDFNPYWDNYFETTKSPDDWPESLDDPIWIVLSLTCVLSDLMVLFGLLSLAFVVARFPITIVFGYRRGYGICGPSYSDYTYPYEDLTAMLLAPFLLIGIFFGLSTAREPIIVNIREMLICGLLDLVFFGAIVFTALLIYINWAEFAEAYPRIGANLFIGWKSRNELAESIDEDNEKRSGDWKVLTICCFLMFLYSNVLCVLWYAYRYNPEGTVNKGWTGVFG